MGLLHTFLWLPRLVGNECDAWLALWAASVFSISIPAFPHDIPKTSTLTGRCRPRLRPPLHALHRGVKLAVPFNGCQICPGDTQCEMLFTFRRACGGSCRRCVRMAMQEWGRAYRLCCERDVRVISLFSSADNDGSNSSRQVQQPVRSTNKGNHVTMKLASLDGLSVRC